MPYVKVGGVWKEATQYVNVDGDTKSVASTWSKINGLWVKIYEKIKTNLLNPNVGYPMDGATSVLEDTSEYTRVYTEWSGTGYIYDTQNLEPFTEYELITTIDIEESPDKDGVQTDMFNLTQGRYVWFGISNSVGGVGVQRITGRFSTGDILPTDQLAIAFVQSERETVIEGPLTFKIFKEGFTLTKV